MRISNPSTIHDLFELGSIIIESCGSIPLANEISGALGDLAHECWAAALAIRFNDSVYDIYHLDVFGNYENGYEVNNQYRVGEVFLPEISTRRNGASIRYIYSRLAALINDEGLDNLGATWTNNGDLIEIHDATGRPWISLMIRNIDHDVSQAIQRIKPNTVNKEFLDFYQELKNLILAAYESDDSGHELVRIKTWTGRLGRAAHYKSLLLGAAVAPRGDDESERWTKWLSATLSPEEVDEVISDEIGDFEERILGMGFHILPNAQVQTNASFNYVETLLLGLVRLGMNDA